MPLETKTVDVDRRGNKTATAILRQRTGLPLGGVAWGLIAGVFAASFGRRIIVKDGVLQLAKKALLPNRAQEGSRRLRARQRYSAHRGPR